MEFCWRADDGPLLWYLDPLSPHQLKRHEIYIYKKKRCQSQNFLDPRLLRERERERKREREREREREHMVPVKLFHIILTSICCTNS